MTVAASPSAATKHQPRFGKDHLVFADWPIGTATYQPRTGNDGEQVDYAEFVIDTPAGKRQSVTLESPSRIGLPTALDHDTLIALILLAKKQDFQSDVVRFVPSQLLQVLGWRPNQKSFQRLKKSLKRLRAVTATYENVWYSRRTRNVDACLITGILAEANIVFRQGRRATGAVSESYIQWTRHMQASFEEGSLVDLDLDLYFSCKRPGAKNLLRHLNKVWHAGTKPRPYSRDLKDLACGHLGLTDCKDLKRNFQDLVTELESCGYLQPADPNVRYEKIRPGVWRVNLDLHPDRVRQKRQSSSSNSDSRPATRTGDDDASSLVRLYHEHRFKKADYVPKQHEVRHAKALLQAHDPTVLAGLIQSVARTVQHQYHGEDVYFGSAVRYFVAAASRVEKQQRVHNQHEDLDAAQAADDAAILKQKQLRSLRREQLLRQWVNLPHDDRAKYVEQAMQDARSEFDRRRISRSQFDSDPPREALEVMALDRGDSASCDASDLHPPSMTDSTTDVPADGVRPSNSTTMR